MANRSRTNWAPGLAQLITPTDGLVINPPLNGLLLGGAGAVSVIMADDLTNSGAGTAITLTGLAIGVIHQIRVKQVRATGTAATGIIGFK